MNRFWEKIMLPIIKFANSKYIVEIGAEKGINTKNILNYCLNYDAKLVSIDPNPLFDVDKLHSQYGERFCLFRDLSLDRLPFLENYDCVLIDGDHNYYTVFHELKVIDKKFNQNNFPLIFLHDVSWPYGRRDLYYNPDNIPDEFLNEYSKLGLYPDEEKLLDEGGFNSYLFNANDENTPKNGVLTAIEDYIENTSLNLDFHLFPAFYGLGIIHKKDSELSQFIDNIIKSNEILMMVEKYYLKTIINLQNNLNDSNKEIELLNEKFSNKKSFVESLIKDNTEKIGQINKLNEKILDMNNKCTSLKRVNDDRNNEIIRLTSELEQISNELSSNKNKIIELNSQIVSLSNSVNNLNNINKVQSEELNKFKSGSLYKRNLVLSKTKQDQFNEINKLKNLIKDLEDRNNTLSETKKQHFDKIVKLNSNQRTLNDKLMYYDKRIMELSNSFNNQNKLFDSLYDKYRNVVNSKYILEEENRYLKGVNNSLNNKLNNILNSHSWKYSSIFRKIRSKFKNN